MRKSAKQEKNIKITQVDGYHNRTQYGINYAYQGFGVNKFFTSDRYIKLDDNFNRPDGKALKGFGIEIETECRGLKNQTVYAEVLNKIVLAEFPEHLFKLQDDGSLGGDVSAEIISQVMTREFIRNHYKEFKAMYNTYFPAFQISCASSGKCGMHVNISNAMFGAKKESQDLAIKKLLYIVNKHFNLFCALTNRNHNLTGYCSRMYSYANKDNAKNATLEHFECSHGVCFNLGHYTKGRVELRIVGGQANYACFRNTMESVFHVVDAVKRLTWEECDDVAKIFAGCNQYVFDRLATKCFEIGAITTDQLRVIQPTVKREELL